jgi:hypothetical protein
MPATARAKLEVNVKSTVLAIAVALLAPALGGSPARAQEACGTWEPMSTPNVGFTANVLHAVAATRDGTVAWAVGYTEKDGPPRLPLAVRWDGSTWNLEPVPMSGSEGLLLGVGLSPKGHVWAVGARVAPFGRSLVAMRWRNGAWDVEATIGEEAVDPGPAGRTPLPVPVTTGLYDVEPVLDDDVWVVGEGVPAAVDPGGIPVLPVDIATPVVARWDGHTFKLHRIPASGRQSYHLRAISAASPDDVWVVGYSRDASLTTTARTYHFDGVAWRLVPNPAELLPGSRLFDVVAISGADVWAVGGSGVDGPVYIHWDGKAWTRAAAPPAGGAALTVDGVASDAVWAASPADYFRYDGTAWTLASSGVPAGSRAGEIGRAGVRRGMVALGRCSALVVGSQGQGDVAVTMAERLRATVPDLPPLTLNASIAGPGTVHLDWTPPATTPPATAIVVERCLGTIATCRPGWPVFQPIAKLEADVLAYDDGGLRTGTYTYVVAAHSQWGLVYSRPVEARVLPSAPGALSAAVVAYDVVRLAWTFSVEKPEAVLVERCVGAPSECALGYVLLEKLDGDTAVYDDAGLKPGTYTYRVAAYAGWLVSYSQPVGVVVPTDSTTPPEAGPVNPTPRRTVWRHTRKQRTGVWRR